MLQQDFRRGLHHGLPIALGYFVVSLTLGLSASRFGMTPLQAMLASFLNHTSSGEFALFSLIGAGASYLEAAITAFVFNMRYFLMSCALSQKATEVSIPHKLIISNFITDEIFGLSAMSGEKIIPKYMYGIIALASPAWILGTYLGALSGNIMPKSIISAASLALYGMFIAVIVPPAKKDRIIAVIVIVSMLLSLAFSIFFKWISSGISVIIITVVISLAAAILFPVKDNEQV